MKIEALRTSESLLLDVIRTLAAITVAFAHLTEPQLQVGWPYSISLARDSVVVFFILSGFVIRYVTCRRPSTLKAYVGDRISRIYSVVLPALLVTAIADAISFRSNSALYKLCNHGSSYHLGQGFLANVFFCAQLWRQEINPMSNSPFWSINYEVAYYAIYAAAFYLTGWKRVSSILTICLFVGPKVLLLFPLWGAGWLAHDLYQRWNASGMGVKCWNLWVFRSAGMLCLLIPVLLLAKHLVANRLHGHMQGFSTVFHSFFLDRLTLGNYAFGVVATVLFLRLLWLVRDWKLEKNSRFAQIIRFIAEGTFPIYLLHYPLLVLAACVIPYHHQSSSQKLLLLACITILGVLAGHPLNLLKLKLRVLGRHLPARMVRS